MTSAFNFNINTSLQVNLFNKMDLLDNSSEYYIEKEKSGFNLVFSFAHYTLENQVVILVIIFIFILIKKLINWVINAQRT